MNSFTHHARSTLKQSMRDFFLAHRYLEVDTPILVKRPGTEVHLGYFSTEWRDYRQSPRRFWLRSSPELHMKILLANELERIFQFGPCFRNDGELGPLHCPEFTMLEYYEVGNDFSAFITRTEDLIRHSLEQLQRQYPQANHFTLPPDIPRISVFDAFRDYVGFELIDNDPDLARKCQAVKVPSVSPSDDFETAFFKSLMDKIEPSLANWPVAVLTDYPPSQAALSQVIDGRAKRFEIYANRVELCNGFLELTDATTNRERIAASDLRRRHLGKDTPVDMPEFFEALTKGIPPCCGNALGFDRLLMLALGESNLANILVSSFTHY